MRFGRFRQGERTGFGLYGDDYVEVVAWDPYVELAPGGEKVSLADVILMTPVVPSKIIGVGLNYSDHAEELGMDIPDQPILFLKAADTLLDPGGTIEFPLQSKRVDYEGELAVVIGQRVKGISPDRAMEAVLGYTCSVDVTARDLQVADGQWTRAKNFDTFCPVGPWVETELDPSELRVELRLNGDLRQSSMTSRMVFDVPYLVSFISEIMTLNPGDLILTGTPPGVGEVTPGDRIELDIEGIGTLECRVGSQGA